MHSKRWSIFLGVLVLTGSLVFASTVMTGCAKPAAAVTYTCPMHPEVKSDKPGKCPKCGDESRAEEERRVKLSRRRCC